ncbi:MAG: hypothetical protein M1814_005233 [Vezdaea aestivalis]|nr:MAG: hypothetical protein M1814_005233 [Vezdaea aestivalis]
MATIKSNYIGKQPLSETDYWIAKVFFPKSKFAFNPNGTWPLTAPARPNVPDRSYLMYIRGGFLLAGGILFTAWRLYM